MVASSARPLGGRWRVALVDHVAAARAAECARVHITAVGCPGTVSVLNTISAWKGRDANRKTYQHGACDADAKAAIHTDTDACDNTITNTNPDSNTSPNADTHPGPNTNPDSSAPDLQPRLRYRHGKRGVEQPYW